MNKAIEGARKKGMLAFHEGKPRICPYADKRGGQYGNIITFSRAFRHAWLEGYDLEKKGVGQVGRLTYSWSE